MFLIHSRKHAFPAATPCDAVLMVTTTMMMMMVTMMTMVMMMTMMTMMLSDLVPHSIKALVPEFDYLIILGIYLNILLFPNFVII